MIHTSVKNTFILQQLIIIANTQANTGNTICHPLREGGSLPAIVEGDDGFLYVLKFRGAGQGVKALNAELIGGELARLAGLKVPEIVFADLDPQYGR